MNRVLKIGHTDGAHYMMTYVLDAIRLFFPNIEVYETPNFEPDILIFSLFGGRSPRYNNCYRILICGEPNDVKGYKYDLLIDTKDMPNLRKGNLPFIYYPFYASSFSERWQNSKQELIGAKLKYPKTKFCIFLYSQSIDFRIRFFDVLNSKKHVDSPGKCRNNTGGPIDRAHYQAGVSSYNDKAVEKYYPYKFVICIENTIQKGYITEKMLSAMLAGAIPIYLGAPDIAEHFNPKSFINIADFASFEEAAEKVLEIDRNDKLYQEMLKEPWLKNNQLTTYFDIQNLSRKLQTYLKDFQLKEVSILENHAFNGDLQVQKQVRKLFNLFNIQQAIETGTFKGNTTLFLSTLSKEVWTCETHGNVLNEAKENAKDRTNIHFIQESSEKVLTKILSTDVNCNLETFFYLDAHWYNYWPLRDELSLINKSPIRDRSIIMIDAFQTPNRNFQYDKYGPHSCSIPYLIDILDKDFPTHHRVFLGSTERHPIGVGKLILIPQKLLIKHKVLLEDFASKEGDHLYTKHIE